MASIYDLEIDWQMSEMDKLKNIVAKSIGLHIGQLSDAKKLPIIFIVLGDDLAELSFRGSYESNMPASFAAISAI